MFGHKREFEKQGSPPLDLNQICKGDMEEFGVITKDLFRLQRISNLERSLLILILDFKSKRKELEEKIEKLKGGNKCSDIEKSLR